MLQDRISFLMKADSDIVDVKLPADWLSAVHDLYLIQCARCKATLTSGDLTDLEGKWELAAWRFMDDFDGKPPHMLCRDCFEWIESELNKKDGSNKDG